MCIKKIYLCAPYSGSFVDDNIEQAIKYGRMVYEEGNIPIIPHVLFPFIKDETTPAERKFAILADLEILKVCDEMYVFDSQKVSLTSGMLKEIHFCKEHKITMRYFWNGKHLPKEDMVFKDE